MQMIRISCFLMNHLNYSQNLNNQDLNNLLRWLKASKLSLNVKKTELIIFHPKNTKLDYSVKYKLNGTRLTPISTVKCLGILLDEHLLLTKQVDWVSSKLNQTTGILSKPRYTTRTQFENFLSLFIWITSTIWRPTLGTRKLWKSK